MFQNSNLNIIQDNHANTRKLQLKTLKLKICLIDYHWILNNSDLNFNIKKVLQEEILTQIQMEEEN